MDLETLRGQLLVLLPDAVRVDPLGVLRLDLDRAGGLPTGGRLLQIVTQQDEPLPPELMELISPDIRAFEVCATLDGTLTWLVVLAWPDGWVLVPDLVEVRTPVLRLAREAVPRDPGGGAGEQGPVRMRIQDMVRVSGEVQLFGLRVDAEVELPSLHTRARLAAGQDLRLRGILDTLHLDGSFLDDLRLKDASVVAAPRSRAVVVGLTIGDVEVSAGGGTLQIESLSAEIRYFGGANSRVGARLAATMGVEVGAQQVRLFLAAEREGPGAGWRFEGATTFDPPVGVVALASGLSRKLGGPAFDVPVDLELRTLAARVDTHSKDVSFQATGSLALGDRLTLPLGLDFESLHQPGGITDRKVRGHLDFPVGSGKPLRFSLVFASRTGGAAGAPAPGEMTLFGASYADEAGTKLGLGDLVGAVDGSVDVDQRRELNALSFTIRRAGFAMLRSRAAAAGAAARPARYLFKVAVDSGVDISALPLIGERLPAGFRIALELSPLYVSAPFTSDEIARVSGLIPDIGDLSGAASAAPPGAAASTSAGRLSLGVALRIGDRLVHFDQALSQQAGMPPAGGLLPGHAEGAAPPSPAPNDAAALVRPPQVTWVPVQKRMGPIALQRVGVGFEPKKQRITVLLDASLGLAGLELTLLGLGVSYGLKERDLTFHIDGMALALDKGGMKLSGVFLRLGEDNYVGEARIQAASWSLGALGAYTKVAGKASIFIYAFLNAPLGGPPFFYVEGLAFGFGYNRSLTVPPVHQIHEFPLVAEVMGTTPPAPVGLAGDPSQTLRTKLEKLDRYLRPTTGEHFIAAGVKFSSFKMLKCFALVAVSFGETFKVDVLGCATFEHPPEAPVKLVFIELNFAVRIQPDDGFVGVEAVLSPRSFIASSDCRLTGGLAFYTWTKTGLWRGHNVRAGDFVLTVGGYHPDYRVPAHYPRVAPLGLNWQLSPQMWLKGSLYFALTPDVVMFGGRLQAHFAAGPLVADFLLTVDFFMRWKPFYFEGRLFIECSITFHVGLLAISGSFGAEIEVWGPGSHHRLSGHARVHLGPVSASLEFGEPKAPPAPLTWDEFRASFIPERPTGTRVADGVIRALPLPGATDPHEKRYVVNPKSFAVETHSVVPLTAWRRDGREVGVGAAGLPPMSAPGRSVGLRSVQSVTITGPAGVTPDHLAVTEVREGFPAALWGCDGAEKVVDAVSGLRIAPARSPAPGSSTSVPRGALGYIVSARPLGDDDATVHARRSVDPWPREGVADVATYVRRRDALAVALGSGAAGRRALAEAFGLATDRLGMDAHRVAASFMDVPQIVEVHHG